MAWLIPLTEWQAEVARRAIGVITRATGSAPAGFSLSDLTLTAPDDEQARRTFVHKGIWPVEFDLDRAVAAGEMTSQRKATLRRSMLSLGDKVENPQHAKGKRL